MFCFQDSDLSVFETTIRFVGGLLSCYALTGDVVFRDKAAEVADALLPAFDTPTGLPFSLINPSTKVTVMASFPTTFNWLAFLARYLFEMRFRTT